MAPRQLVDILQGTNRFNIDANRPLVAHADECPVAAVAHVEVMYPDAIKAASSTFTLSLRNHIYNDIMSIAELHDEAAIRARLAENAAHRKRWVGMYRKMRAQDKAKSNHSALKPQENETAK